LSRRGSGMGARARADFWRRRQGLHDDLRQDLLEEDGSFFRVPLSRHLCRDVQSAKRRRTHVELCPGSRGQNRHSGDSAGMTPPRPTWISAFGNKIIEVISPVLFSRCKRHTPHEKSRRRFDREYLFLVRDPLHSGRSAYTASKGASFAQPGDRRRIWPRQHSVQRHLSGCDQDTMFEQHTSAARNARQGFRMAFQEFTPFPPRRIGNPDEIASIL